MSARRWGIAAILATLMVMLSAPLWLTLMFAANASRKDPCTTVVPDGISGPIRLPITGAYSVTSEYGMRANPGQMGHGDVWLHDGIDFAMSNPEGPVVSAMRGVVASLPTGGMEGNAIVIDHGSGLLTRYLHLSSRTVTVGQAVHSGQVIGLQGSTGNSTGAHLHFTVVQAGRATDPRPWLKARGVDVGTGGVAPPPTSGQPVDRVPRPGPDLELSLDDQPDTPPQRIGVWGPAQLQIAATIIAVGHQRNLDAWTIAVAVMTAMGESSLTNVDHGDAVRGDTIGVFQEGPERGSYVDRMNPAAAAGIFYDYLLRVPSYHSLEPTIAAHRAQANADPYHYERWWADAVQVVETLSGDDRVKGIGGTLPDCEEDPATPPAPGGGTAADIVSAARHWIGTPYSWGGGGVGGPSTGIYTSPVLDGTATVGFDCSGLTQYAVHHALGITLPRTADAQARDSRAHTVAREDLQPGDLVAFSHDGPTGRFTHIGIYTGDGQMIHAPRVGDAVKIEQIKGVPYWEQQTWRISRHAEE